MKSSRPERDSAGLNIPGCATSCSRPPAATRRANRRTVSPAALNPTAMVSSSSPADCRRSHGGCAGPVKLLECTLDPGEVAGVLMTAGNYRIDAVHRCRIHPEDLLLEFRGQLGISVRFLHPLRNLERAESVYRALSGAVPDAVGAPEHIVGPDGVEQLTEHMGCLQRAFDEAVPRGAELGATSLTRIDSISRFTPMCAVASSYGPSRVSSDGRPSPGSKPEW